MPKAASVLCAAFCCALFVVVPVPAGGGESAGVLLLPLGKLAEDINRISDELKARESERLAQLVAMDKTPFKGFFLICVGGSAQDMEKALKAGADPNAGDPDRGGTPPLVLAAGINPDPGVIRLLLKAGADANFVGRNFKRTALHQALLHSKNAGPVIRELLVARPDLYVEDVSGMTPLDYAIRGTPTYDGRGYVTFDGKPREDLMLPLLKAGAEFAGSAPDPERADFYARKLSRYKHAAYYHPNPEVVEAFRKAEEANAGKPRP
jgi:hypothetical protein